MQSKTEPVESEESDEQDESPDDQKEENEEILRIAKERFELAVEAETKIRTEALDDLKFSAGDQWPQDVKNQRHQDMRPTITINRMPQFVRQITNDNRQNRPAIKVSPVGNGANVETAEIKQGMIRHIEVSSDADTAYDTAFESAVKVGFGFFRIYTDYCDPMSFDQDIKVGTIHNRFSCYLDPFYRKVDGSDAQWGFVFEDLSKDEFEATYPDASASAQGKWESLGDQGGLFVKEESIRVAEYFTREYEKKDIYQIATMDGQKTSVTKEDLQGVDPSQIKILGTRTSLVPKIKWYKLTALEILECTDWPGKWIPIVPVLGEVIDVDGERILEGIVRHAKDPQRMLNYWKSAETEAISLAPKAPWIVAHGQLEGFEPLWKTANIKNHAYLPYKNVISGGQQVPPPQRNVFEPAVAAITNASMQAADDLKATTGVYDSALGASAPESSGVAIQRRNVQSQTSNFHFHDNLSKSIRHAGRIILDLMPHIYDTERAVRILQEDGQDEVVLINQIFNHNGKPVRYDMASGDYDVTVNTGPSFETKRQEAAAMMADLSRSNPALMQVAGDLMVRNLDLPGGQEIADRLKKMLPPQLQGDQNGPQQLPPQVQAQMSQMGQMIDTLTKELNAAHDILKTKMPEIQSRERIEMAKIQANVEMKMAELGAKGSQQILEHEIDRISNQMDVVGFGQPIQNQSPAPQVPDQSSQPGVGQPMPPPPSQVQQPTGGQTPGNNPMGAP